MSDVIVYSIVNDFLCLLSLFWLDPRFEDKALMVVKDPSFLRTAPACQPPVNRTKCMKYAPHQYFRCIPGPKCRFCSDFLNHLDFNTVSLVNLSVSRLVNELRGWVHRHEVEQTKSRRLSNSQQKPTRTILVSGRTAALRISSAVMGFPKTFHLSLLNRLHNVKSPRRRDEWGWRHLRGFNRNCSNCNLKEWVRTSCRNTRSVVWWF